MLDVMFKQCAGLDVHKKSVTACGSYRQKGESTPRVKTLARPRSHCKG